MLVPNALAWRIEMATYQQRMISSTRAIPAANLWLRTILRYQLLRFLPARAKLERASVSRRTDTLRIS